MYGGTNSQIDTVRLISCGLTGGSGMTGSDSYGLQIGVGQNIQVLGGHYSGNGATAGIAIVGGATQVQIIGANCIGLEYEDKSTPLYQLYGIFVTNGTRIQIVGVTCSGNGLPGDPGSPGYGIYVDGTDSTVSDVRIIGAVCTGPLGDTDIAQQTGIYVNDAQGVLVKDCNLSGSTGDSGSGSGCGIYLVDVSDVTVKACDLNGNVTGLGIDTGSTRVFVRDCNAAGY
jgi:nitrous oxidase accessory protein NosD